MREALRGLLLLSVFGGCSSSAVDSAPEPDKWLDIDETTGETDSVWAEGWPDGLEAIGEGALLVRSVESGERMELSWAQQSDVACFPGTQNDRFEGPHLLFALEQKPEQFLTIRATPEAELDLSLYTLQQGANAYQVPPDISSAVACEASLSGLSGEAEEIQLWAPPNPYNLVIGVAGTQGEEEGRFLLEVVRSD